jgi:hypothetical protein
MMQSRMWLDIYMGVERAVIQWEETMKLRRMSGVKE